MSYNFVADSFHTQKLCSTLSSSEVRFHTDNGRFAFLSPPFFGGGGRLRGNVRWSSCTHYKARSGLPISVNWTFFARCYGWGAIIQAKRQEQSEIAYLRQGESGLDPESVSRLLPKFNGTFLLRDTSVITFSRKFDYFFWRYKPNCRL